MAGRKRRTFEQQSVLAWKQDGETYEEAKRRLDAAWRQGQHPVQLREKANAQDL